MDAAPMLKTQASIDVCRNKTEVFWHQWLMSGCCSAAREICGSAEGGLSDRELNFVHSAAVTLIDFMGEGN